MLFSKKKLSLLLCLCLVCAWLALPASAADGGEAVQAVQTLGILTGDGSGSLNLSRTVTRAEFAKMLTAASSYKDTISGDGTGYSLYKDVKSGHWASEYIRLAVQQGWMTGYTDGTFRPDQAVKLEEACSAALKLLGYDTASLAGSFPYAQLNKAGSLGLRSQVSAKQGESLTRQDCAQLFYNLLNAKTGSGQVYASTLGYSLTNGKVDYTSIALDALSGPYIADSASPALPFTPATVYRNGVRSSSASIQKNDVYYYNAGMSALWVCTDRVSGKVSALSPSALSPTSVTISGKSYSIGSSSAAYQLSALTGDITRETVTLLLGLDGSVVGVLTGDEVNAVYYGIVESAVKSASEDAAVQSVVAVLCTDGSTRSFTLEKSVSYSAGQLIAVSVTDGGITAKALNETRLSGTVNSAATKLGSYFFADDIEILDTNSAGGAVSVSPDKLAGLSLSGDDVRYYALNAAGKLEYLILNDVTGDTWSYAYLTSLEEQSQEMNLSGSYTWVMDGKEQTLRSATQYSVSVGGIAISYQSDGSVKSMKNLTSVKLTSLSSTYAVGNNKKLLLSDNVQVYLRESGGCYLTELSAVNAEDYTLTGWLDSALGQVRIITAVAKKG